MILNIEEIKNCRYWKLVHSVIKKVENSNIEENDKQKIYQDLYQLEDINKNLLDAAELVIVSNMPATNAGEEIIGLDRLYDAIKQAKGDDE